MQTILKTISNKENEIMKNHTTFRIGGPARYFFEPKNAYEISTIIKCCKEERIKCMVLGNGSNVLFLDEGYEGAIIHIYNNMNNIKCFGETIYAEAGALLSKVANIAKENDLTGMEFAAGIPGTIGGAIVMNAGAYGGEMKHIVKSVKVLEDGEEKTYKASEMEFSYRHSIIDSNKVVTAVELELKKGNREEIAAKMDELKKARVLKQPLEYPSAGSTFKRPEGYFAGKLVQDCGLKGYRVGGAMVSEKHSGFVINYDNATADDVITLMKDVSKIVKEKFDVVLEPEVRVIL